MSHQVKDFKPRFTNQDADARDPGPGLSPPGRTRNGWSVVGLEAYDARSPRQAAAHHLAKIPVVATDIDPVAIRVARDNIRINHAAAGIITAVAPGFHHAVFREHGPFDLIIANILARPLMKLAPELVKHLADGGTVILSGILSAQRWKVISAYNGAGLKHMRTTWMNGWVTIELRR